jgi:hypothetical protein
MTAYLRPGDKIHLVIPKAFVHGVLDGTARNLALSREAYGALGVEIFDYDVSGEIDAPVIVAVIRADPPAQCPAEGRQCLESRP